MRFIREVTLLGVVLFGFFNTLIAQEMTSGKNVLKCWENDLFSIDTQSFEHPFKDFDMQAGIVFYDDSLYMIGGNGTHWNKKYNQWELWVGTDIDNLELVVKPEMEEYFPNYYTSGNQDWAIYWPMGLWVDEETGFFYSIAYTEYNFMNMWKSEAKERRMGIMLSKNRGRTWVYQGDIITQDKSAPPPDGHVFNGAGDTRLFISPDGYAYAFYKRGYYNKTTLVRNITEICVARCKLSDKLAPGKWKKYYNGKWEEPGIGGHATVIQELSGSVSPFYSKYLDRFFLIGKDIKDKQYIVQASDLGKQDWGKRNYEIPKVSIWYLWFYDPKLKSGDIMGQDFRLYSSGLNKKRERIGFYHNIRFK